MAPTIKPTDIPTETPAPAAEDIFSYTIENNQVTITGLKDESVTSIVIPSTIENYPVTAIGECAFYRCFSITSLSIPDSVTSIGEGAFWHCWRAKIIDVPESLLYTSFTDTGSNYVNTYTFDIIGRSIISEFTKYDSAGNKIKETICEYIPEKQFLSDGQTSEFMSKKTTIDFDSNGEILHKSVIEYNYDEIIVKKNYYDSNDKLIRRIVTEPGKCTCYDSEGNKLIEYGVSQFVKIEAGNIKEYDGDTCVLSISYDANIYDDYERIYNIYAGEEAVKSNTVTGVISYRENDGAWSLVDYDAYYLRIEFAEYDSKISMTLHRSYESTCYEKDYMIWGTDIHFPIDMYYSFEE